MKSIEQRIRLGLIITLLATFTILGVLAHYGVKQLSRDFVLTRLQHDSDSLVKALSLSSDQQWLIEPEYIPAIYQRVQSGHYFQVITQEQQLRSRSLWDRTPAVTPLARGQTKIHIEDSGEERWLIWQQRIELHETLVTLWIAEDIAPLERQWQRLTVLLSATMLIALLLLVALQRYLLRRSFAQLTDLQQAIKQLKQGEISAITATVPTEIKPLTNEINHLLERLEQRTSRSRTAMGNLAHELKRHLQQLYLFSSNLPGHLTLEYRQTLEQISRLIERELKRARIAGDSHPGRRFNPNDDLSYLMDIMKKIYPQIELVTEIEAIGELPFDRDDMLELIGNLVDNACKFGLSNARFSLALVKPNLVLNVSNDSADIATLSPATWLDRGVRTDETTAGHGLGLSICKMIVASYQGKISIEIEPGDAEARIQVSVSMPLF